MFAQDAKLCLLLWRYGVVNPFMSGWLQWLVEVKEGGGGHPLSNATNLHLVLLDRIPPPVGNLSVVPVCFSHPKDFQSTPA